MLGREKRKVRLFLQDGPTIEGVQAGRTRSDYIIWAPRVVEGDGKDAAVAVSGHVEVERARVVWRQVIG